MAGVQPQQAHHFPRDPFPYSIPRQPHNHALQNPGVLPAADNGQLEGYQDNIPPQIRGIAGLVGQQDPHHIDVAYHGVVDYHPQPLGDPAAQYVFPNVGLGQGIPAQAPPDAPEDQEYVLYGHPQRVAPGPAQAAFPYPFVHRVPVLDQPQVENLRRLAGRYLHHPDSQVDMVTMEAGAAGRFKVVIVLVLETTNVL